MNDFHRASDTLTSPFKYAFTQKPLALALTMLLATSPGFAASIDVTKDAVDTKKNGNCSLLEAITAANTDKAVDQCVKGNGADTINLPANSTFVLSKIDNNSVNDGANGLPTVTSNITIEGQDSRIERSNSAPAFRVFHIASGAELKLLNTTITGGVTGNGDYYVANGAGIFSRGMLTLENCVVSENKATGLGAGGDKTAGGGGIFSIHSSLNLKNSRVTNNESQYGGGVFLQTASATVTNSDISDNSSTQGGGIGARELSTMTLTDSSFSGNSAKTSGGGIYAGYGSILTMARSTVSGNTSGRGGGLSLYKTNGTLSNLTISDNSASSLGGGIDMLTSTVSLTHITIADNTASDLGGGLYLSLDANVSIVNSIVSNSKATDCSEANVFLYNINNWFSDASCDGNAKGNPKLGPLADNGGKTLTRALLEGSGALDAADDQQCVQDIVAGKDQREQPRPGINNASCDIGAFEKQSTNTPPTPVPPIDVPVNPSDLEITLASATFDHRNKAVGFPNTSTFTTTPLVIVGPPTTRGGQPGNVRIDQVTNAGFRIHFKEYDYLFAKGQGAHATEIVDYLALEPGIYQLQNGTIIEAGSFTIDGTGKWITQQLSANFPTEPTIIATLQTVNGGSSVMIRLDQITTSSFNAALYEEEKKQRSGHVREEAGFIAIYQPESTGNLPVNNSLSIFELSTIKLGVLGKTVGSKTQLRLEEEQSADLETKHFAAEDVDVLLIGEGVFAQIATKSGGDTIDLRKKDSN
jgi:predicted outer membrane repeat protein